jgi:hypothetical protein
MRNLFAIQGIFYLINGLWPIFHISSFMAVTGEKTDLWLVKTVGGLIALSGLAFFRERFVTNPSKTLAFLALGQAAFLTGIDVYYVAKGTISPVYLIDALAESGLIALWIKTLWLLGQPPVRLNGSSQAKSQGIRTDIDEP